MLCLALYLMLCTRTQTHASTHRCLEQKNWISYRWAQPTADNNQNCGDNYKRQESSVEHAAPCTDEWSDKPISCWLQLHFQLVRINHQRRSGEWEFVYGFRLLYHFIGKFFPFFAHQNVSHSLLILTQINSKKVKEKTTREFWKRKTITDWND